MTLVQVETPEQVLAISKTQSETRVAIGNVPFDNSITVILNGTQMIEEIRNSIACLDEGVEYATA